MTDNLSTIAKPEASCSAAEMQQSSGIIQNVLKKINLASWSEWVYIMPGEYVRELACAKGINQFQDG